MCGIYGALGSPDWQKLNRLSDNTKDRGRDGGGIQMYPTSERGVAVLGNWRATPTTELMTGRSQPYGGIVHNGTIANAEQLGLRPDQIDSEILPQVLVKRDNIDQIVSQLGLVVGSYALGIYGGETVYLAANYKPLYYWSPDGMTTYFASMERHFKGVTPFGQRPVKLTPYSVIDLGTGQTRPLPRLNDMSVAVICSGGLDSVTVATKFAVEGYRVTLLHFLYGCHATKEESRRIPEIAKRLGCDYRYITLDYEEFKGSSTLFGDVGSVNQSAGGIGGAEYATEWVPSRNMVMLAVASAWSEANGYHLIALGNNLEESGAFPDNEEELTTLYNQMLPNVVRDGYSLEVVSPVGHLMKHEIVSLGLTIGAPYELTYSCYMGGEVHCGQCGPCYMRRVAFERNGQVDPVVYRS